MNKTKQGTIIMTVLMLLVISSVSLALAQAATVTVKTDKTAYTPGNTLTVSGTSSPVTSGQAIAIQVKGPSGNTIVVDQITPNTDGTYSKAELVFASTASSGVWTVTATYQGVQAIASFTFTGVPPVTSITPTVSAQVGSQYLAGQTVDAYVLVTYMSAPIDANVTANLYMPGTTTPVALTPVTRVSMGLYKVSYALSASAATGTYDLFTNATISTAVYKGTAVTMTSFQTSQTLTSIASAVSTMQTAVTSMQGAVTSMQGSVSTIQASTTGTQTAVSSLQTDVSSLQTSVSGLSSAITGVKSDVAGVKSDVAGVKSDVDSVSSSVSSVSSAVSTVTTVVYIAIVLSLIAAIAAIYAIIVIQRKIAA